MAQTTAPTLAEIRWTPSDCPFEALDTHTLAEMVKILLADLHEHARTVARLRANTRRLMGVIDDDRADA